MKYTPPIGSTDPDAGYLDRNGSTPGSPVPAAAIEPSMREIVNVIVRAGLTPDGADMTQLEQALDVLIAHAMPKIPNVYELCEFYFFRHPTLRPGFQPAQGGLLANAATLYPDAWDYLTNGEGQRLCKNETEWQAMTTATWATLADGTKVGWNGIGGAPFYAPNTATGELRLPDLRGMYAEAAGFDALGVGGVHGDAIRGITGQTEITSNANGSTGPFTKSQFTPTTRYLSDTGSGGGAQQGWMASFTASRVVPTASKNQPRAWGAYACVYLGTPTK